MKAIQDITLSLTGLDGAGCISRLVIVDSLFVVVSCGLCSGGWPVSASGAW